jgi:spore coat polysaccharide biosynthesis predicted glycosyltransferase SpsG
MENHVDIKDLCDGIDTRLNEIAGDIRDIPFDYKLVDKYSHIDEDLYQIYEWYDRNKIMIDTYIKEKVAIEEKIKEIDRSTRHLNNMIQNTKSQPHTVRRGGSLSQLDRTDS